MPQLDGTGPEKKGARSGRGLGRCKSNEKSNDQTRLGTGMALKRKSGGGKGKGKRLQSGKQE